MATCLAHFTFVMVAVTITFAFPNGGPYYSCKGLLPGHNDGPQSTSPPCKLSVSHATVPVGGSTSVTLEGLNSTPFMGFMCATSVFDDETNRPCGTFSLTTASSDISQLLQCSSAPPDTAVTHVNRTLKHRVGFDWTVPADATIGSTYKIRCTFVESFDIYWINTLVKVTVVGDNKNITSSATVSIENSTTASGIKTTDAKQANTESTTQAGTRSTTQAGTGSTTQAGIGSTTQTGTGTTMQSKTGNTTQAGNRNFGVTQGNLGSSSSIQFNVVDSVAQVSSSPVQTTEEIPFRYDLFRVLELHFAAMSGLSTPLDFTDKTFDVVQF